MSDRARRRAAELHVELGVRDEHDLLDLDALLFQMGALVIADDDMCGAIGALVRAPRERHAVIRHRADLPHGRARFTVGHEAGHLVLHEPRLYWNCHEGDVFSPDTRVRLEQEANAFAAAFLMPLDAWRDKLEPRPIRESLKALAKRYGVSLTAAALRAVHTSREPLCLVACHGQQVKWSWANDEWKRSAGRRPRPSAWVGEWACVTQPVVSGSSYQAVEGDQWGLDESLEVLDHEVRRGEFSLCFLSLP